MTELWSRPCTSSYFEFNPYPIRSQSYTVYQCADAPAGPVDLLQKALYVLDIRPSGTRVSIIAWARTDNTAYCIQYDLPGSGKFLTTAPLVIRSAGKSGEDWLVWWRRFDWTKPADILPLLLLRAPIRPTGRRFLQAHLQMP